MGAKSSHPRITSHQTEILNRDMGMAYILNENAHNTDVPGN